MGTGNENFVLISQWVLVPTILKTTDYSTTEPQENKTLGAFVLSKDV